MNKIDSKIIGYGVVTPENKQDVVVLATALPEERPYMLSGKTYSIPGTDKGTSRLDLTINDVEVEGKLYPYEVIISDRDPNTYQWTLALSMVLSSIMQTKPSLEAFTKLFSNIESIADASGSGRFKKGSGYIGLVAEIGQICLSHVKSTHSTHG